MVSPIPARNCINRRATGVYTPRLCRGAESPRDGLLSLQAVECRIYENPA